MTRERLTFELVALGATMRWHLVHRPDSDRGRTVAEIDFVPAAQEWRLRPRGIPELSDTHRATWSHNGQQVRSAVPAWLRRDAVDQLAGWLLDYALARVRGKSKESAK